MSSDENELPTEQWSAAPTTGLDELNIHSFVLRIWREEVQTTNGVSLWRGHITHVQSGKRHYFQQLHGVVTFISTYLPMPEYIGSQPTSLIARLRQWWRR